MAQSLERSMLQVVGKQKVFDTKDNFQQSIEDEFVNYPNFLAWRKVLLGLLFTAKTNINNSNEETTRKQRKRYAIPYLG